MNPTTRHRYSFQRRIRPRCRAPIASHIALGAVVALLIENINLVRRQINEPKLQRELYRLAQYLGEFKCFADAQVFAQFPVVTGFDARTLARVYYGAAHPLSRPEILELVRFEAKADALKIPRGDRAKLAECIAKGQLLPFRGDPVAELSAHPWKPSDDAAELIERASQNFATLAEFLRASGTDETACDAEEDI